MLIAFSLVYWLNSRTMIHSSRLIIVHEIEWLGILLARIALTCKMENVRYISFLKNLLLLIKKWNLLHAKNFPGILWKLYQSVDCQVIPFHSIADSSKLWLVQILLFGFVVSKLRCCFDLIELIYFLFSLAQAHCDILHVILKNKTRN